MVFKEQRRSEIFDSGEAKAPMEADGQRVSAPRMWKR